MNSKELAISKYCYDFWKQSNWNTSKLVNIKNAVGIKDDELAIKVIRKYAKNYATEVLNMSNDDFYAEIEKHKDYRIHGRSAKNNYFKLLEILSDIDFDDKKSIIDVMDKFENIDFVRFKNKIANHVILYRNKEPNLVKDLNSKVDFYRQIQIEKRKKEKEGKLRAEQKGNLEAAKNFINSYIESDYKSKDLFCKKVNLPIEEFNKYIKLVEKYEPEIFKLYSDKSTNNSNIHDNLILRDIKKVANKLKNNDEFNLVDYYLIKSKSYDLNDFWENCKTAFKKNIISEEEFSLIKDFFNKNFFQIKKTNTYKIREVNPIQIMKTSNVVGMECDKYGNIIEGSGRVVTDKEKQLAIKFLQDNEIPICYKTYNIVRDRIISEQEQEHNKNIIKK